MNAQQSDIIPFDQVTSLGAILPERIRRSPDAVAYVQFDPATEQWENMTWKTFGEAVSRWQAGLSSEGLTVGDRVAVMVRNCREWAMFDLAAQGLGLVTVPVYTNDRPENIGYIIQDASASLLLLESVEQLQTLGEIGNQLAGLKRIIVMEEIPQEHLQPRLVSLSDWLPDQGEELVALDSDPDTLATIVYTSGTTGRCKGVMLSHRNILWNVHASLKAVAVYPSDIFLSFLPLSHTLERTAGYYLPMVAGSRVAYARSILSLADDLLEIRPTLLISVPRIFERVYAKIQDKLAGESVIARALFLKAVDIGWKKFLFEQQRARRSASFALWPLLEKLVASKVQAKLGGRLRFAVSGGAALAPEVARLFIGLGITIVQGYGLTETSPVIAANTLENNVPASVGMPVSGVEVKVAENGELLTRSPCVMLGYWNNAEATREIIDEEGWLHTGDKVRMENGHIFITGRLKEIIVLSNGEKVPPADMEMAIALDTLFEQVMVIGEGRPFLSALVVPNPEQLERLSSQLNLDADDPAIIDNSALKDAISERISAQLYAFPGYAQIRQIALIRDPWTVENGMLTPTLKLRRSRILDHYRAQTEDLYKGH